MKYLKFAGIVIAVSLGLLVLKAALFPVVLASKAIDSVGGVLSKTIEPNNVIANYEWFFDADAQVKSRLSQIKAHSELVAKETNTEEKSRLNIELAAMRQSCRDLSTKYNADSLKLNKELFKSKNLPFSLNIKDCEV